MPRDSRFDILFEPVKIGPKTAKNRFYQVPHCNGMGYRDPTAMAYMRGVKAEGGWAVVSTEQIEIHPTGEITPFIEARLWEDKDIPALARMVDKVHEHGALAAAELCHNGMDAPNLWSREVPIGPIAGCVATFAYHPVQARAMDLTDIKAMRRWHRAAALRARRAGFDLIYVYSGHALSFLHHFLSRRFNQRTDAYGGSLANRVWLLREIIEDTKDAVGDRCAVPVRISIDELAGGDGLERAEVEDMIGLLAELPDLWDVCLAGWANDSVTSRFGGEGDQEPYFAHIKRLTTKPVVGVGRYTSPDRMVEIVAKGLVDMIGAARPSIADPFLPSKIEDGRFEDIRECIGCNICVAGDFTMAPIRCTQNPTMGEEWRRGWHPERFRARGSDKTVLVVGAGPAGLEAAQTLGKRGYEVTLAEADDELGGRVRLESRLPGLAAWIRVRDHRRLQLDQLVNVQTFRASRLDADDVLELGHAHVAVATGSRWRTDAVGHRWLKPLALDGAVAVIGPDDILGGRMPDSGPVLIWDDDHYYMAGVLAEALADTGHQVTLATPAAEVSTWSRNTMEQPRIQARLLEKGVAIRPHLDLVGIDHNEVVLACVFTGKPTRIAASSLLPVTSRISNDGLAGALRARASAWADHGVASVTVIGDALAPATIAHAVFAGRAYAEALDRPALADGELAYRREITALADLP